MTSSVASGGAAGTGKDEEDNGKTTSTSCFFYSQEQQEQPKDDNEQVNDNWERMFKRLRKYRQKRGDCLVPTTCDKNPKLSQWVKTQRVSYKKGTLTKERIARLNSVGFVWSTVVNTQKHDWETMFRSLEEYKRENGDCLVPQQSHPELSAWVDRQRATAAAAAEEENDDEGSCCLRLLECWTERKKRLEDLGFVWKVAPEESWDSMYLRLKECMEAHDGLPQRYAKDEKLGNWVEKQRYLKSQKRLAPEREKKLNLIEFPWSVTQETWDAMFAELKEYKEKNGDCVVPFSFDENPRLGRWVKEQRKKKEHMLDSRKERLDSIGFIWSVPQARWEARFKQLLEFRKVRGDCNVPKRYPPNRPLGRWVHNQRLRKHVMPYDRLDKLEAVGFFDSTFARNRRLGTLSATESSTSRTTTSSSLLRADIDKQQQHYSDEEYPPDEEDESQEGSCVNGIMIERPWFQSSSPDVEATKVPIRSTSENLVLFPPAGRVRGPSVPLAAFSSSTLAVMPAVPVPVQSCHPPIHNMMLRDPSTSRNFLPPPHENYPNVGPPHQGFAARRSYMPPCGPKQFFGPSAPGVIVAPPPPRLYAMPHPLVYPPAGVSYARAMPMNPPPPMLSPDQILRMNELRRRQFETLRLHHHGHR